MRYGEVLPKDFKMPFGLGSDLKRNPFEPMTIRRGDVCMDVGACTGSWSIAAMEEGAAAALAYEPHPKNFQETCKNLMPYGARTRVMQAAMVGDRRKTVTLHLGMSVAHTLVERKTTTKHIDVPAVRFRDELKKVRPEVLKVDVEGAEYGMFAGLKPGDLRTVRSIFVEFHSNSEHRLSPDDPGVKAIRQYIVAEGLTEVATKRLKAYVAERRVAQILVAVP